MTQFHILAGPPGAGKTTVLEILRARLAVVPEPARRVLAEQRTKGGQGTGDSNQSLFVRLMLDMAQADYAAASGVTIFDRGLPDMLAFCAHYGLPSGSVRRAITAQRYGGKVFWFPPWQAIYTQDDERKLDFDGAKRFGNLIAQSYRQSGYAMIPVPKTTPEERASFILTRIRS